MANPGFSREVGQPEAAKSSDPVAKPNNQILQQLRSHDPAIVLPAIPRASGLATAPLIQGALERLFSPQRAAVLFRGKASEASLWQVHLAAGQTLRKEMLPEIQARTNQLLLRLEATAQAPLPNETAYNSYLSAAETTIGDCMDQLLALDQPARSIVEGEAVKAAIGPTKQTYAALLDMALLRFGNQSKTEKVRDYLQSSPVPTVRIYAAITLGKVADKAAIPTLYTALKDPYQRRNVLFYLSRFGPVRPVRFFAAEALENLGQDRQTINELLRQRP